DANPGNIGKVLKTDVCVQADAGAFLAKLLEQECVRRPVDGRLCDAVRRARMEEARHHCAYGECCGVPPMALVLELRPRMPEDGMVFVDVTCSEHLAAEGYRVFQPRTYFNPTDNQAMGWSIPASLGAQRAFPDRCVATITGDGCFLMAAMEITTAARAGLPVKFFVLDDHTY